MVEEMKLFIKAGYSLADARNYTAIGCVEPTSQGKTLGSTDAAIINMPLALELAAWGVDRPKELSWMDPPPATTLDCARDLLTDLGARVEGRLGRRLPLEAAAGDDRQPSGYPAYRR